MDPIAATGTHLLRAMALLAAVFAIGPDAHAQANRPWVDPPADLGASSPPPQAQPAPPEPATPSPPAPPVPSDTAGQNPPSPPPPETAHPDRSAPSAAKGDPQSERTEAARNLTIRYLQSWSAATNDTLDATAEFYAPRVLFHGRPVSLRNLMREKRRFIRRWPERRYRPLENTIQVACEAQGDDCAVQAIFDFSAASPRRGRQTEGTGALQLVVSFVDNQPIISAESSLVLDQGADDQIMTPEDSDDD